jgi:O-antigen/teichoic acid export membrane protein
VFGLQMLATSGLHSIGGRLSDICLGKLQGLGALGIYNRAGSLNGLLWNNVHMIVGRVMFVEFAGLHREGVGLRDRYIATVDVVTALLWPAFAGLALISGPVIMVLYGERWLPAALPMALLSVSSIILVSITMTWEIFTATRQFENTNAHRILQRGNWHGRVHPWRRLRPLCGRSVPHFFVARMCGYLSTPPE